MRRYPDGPALCGGEDDPSCKPVITSMGDVGPIIIFSFWGLVFTSCTTFQLYKWVLQRRSPVNSIVHRIKGIVNQNKSIVHGKETMLASEKDAKRDSKFGASNHTSDVYGEDTRLNLESEIELHFTGYKTSIFGEFCYGLACLMSLQYIALYLLILVDYYNDCQVLGIDSLCFYGNYFIFGSYDLNSKVFFVVWWLSAIWFTTWVINKGKVHRWFRWPCKLSQASFVFVWEKKEPEILPVNVFLLVHLLRFIKTRLMPGATREHFDSIVIQTTKLGQRFFLYHGQRFLINDDSLDCASLNVRRKLSEFHKGETGLTLEEAKNGLEQIGSNEIPLKLEPLLYIIFDELFSVFHIYQLLMYMIWFWFSYLFVSLLLVMVVIISASISIYIRHRSQTVLISKVAQNVTEVDVVRDGKWIVVDSHLLVPGDVLRVRSAWVLPCDLLILHGTCVCDESALTGESMPVQKYAAPNTQACYESEGQGTRHTLFSGTTVLQAGTNIGYDILHAAANVGDEVRAIVVATGMATSKGKILSGILFPENMHFKYDEELAIVVIILMVYVLACFGLGLYFQYHTGAKSDWVVKWIYVMLLISQIISPLLPVALEVGQVQAVERLKGLGIFCLNPHRIAIAGKVRIFLFDKTGSLTKEGLDFIGTQSVVSSKDHCRKFGDIKLLEEGDIVDDLTLHGLATCHTLTKLADRFVGNEVEVKMFTAIGWNLVETPDEPPLVQKHAGSEPLHIVKRNEFDHVRTTMSVIVQDSQNRFHVYCKGAFEKVKDLSSPDTLPNNYIDVGRNHALEGCYVLALGHRLLNRGISLHEVLALSRDELEDSLEFVSFILFRNELKPDSQGAIEDLKSGEVRPVMVTGDNAQCGYYIAKECSLAAKTVKVILGDMQQNGRVEWSFMSSQEESRGFSTDELLTNHTPGLQEGIVELAVTGMAFNILRSTNSMERLLLFTRIFARFTPADKVNLVDMYQARGLIAGMCGDGGNDCGALRAAHVGIALSDTEASAVSPFTSTKKTVMSAVDLLREGRGALHTSFACFKFLIMYGLMFSILKLSSYWYGVIPCQMDYIFIDGVAVLSLGYAMTLSYPAGKLGKVRPTSNLLGPLTVGSVLGVFLINLCFMIGSLFFMKIQPGYLKWPAKNAVSASWWTLGDNWESTVIFFTMYFQLITSSFVFSFGATFRKNVFFNKYLMVTYVSLLAFMSVLLLLPQSGLTELWHVASEQFNEPNTASKVWQLYQGPPEYGSPSPAMPFSFRFKLWWILMANIVTVIAWQKVVVEGPVSAALARRFPSTRERFRL